MKLMLFSFLVCSLINNVILLNNQNKNDNFFDEASYSFNGFTKLESIPVIFPKDICMFDVQGIKYAASLYISENKTSTLVIHKIQNGTYKTVLTRNAPHSVGLDCNTLHNKGYVVLGLNLSKTPKKASECSPVYEITDGKAKIVQYFADLNLNSVHLIVNHYGMFLMLSFKNASLIHLENVNCPYFEWSESSFHMLGKIPCSNAKRLEQFEIHGETYIAVANYADKYGQLTTNSEIYKYDRNHKQFIIFQKIKTSGATDVKYFQITLKTVATQHFLIFANSIEMHGTNQSHEANSIIYKFDKDLFVPYQKLLLYAVKQFLPIQAGMEKFILLVSCQHQETKVYQLNDWKFEESSTQLTEGALGKGVSNMRAFQQNDETYLVIANEKMLQNATNVYMPIFKQEQYVNELRKKILDWTENALKKLTEVDIEKLNADLNTFIKTRRITVNSTKETKEAVEKMKFKRILTKSLNYAPKNMTHSFWKLLGYSQQAITVLTKQFENKKIEYNLMKKKTNSRNSRLALDIDSTLETVKTIDSMEIDTLIVENKLIANQINGVEQNGGIVTLQSISAPKIVLNKIPQTFINSSDELIFDTIKTKKLNVAGTLNNVSFEMIYNNALRNHGNQVIDAPVKINQFKTKSITVTNGMISDQNISKLILINGRNYAIEQNVEFSRPIYAKHVEVRHRINNIHVNEGKLDVLLTKSDELQIITGIKNFENVNLLEAVIIGGKISGKHLEKMIPLTQIDKNITVTGNFIITGNVTVQKSISASNYFGEMKTKSVKEIIKNGLKKTDAIEDLNLKFHQPIHAKNLNISAINGINVDQLVKMNTKEIQVITGHKTFVGDLQISRGLCETNEINGINVEQLENNILTKFGDQNITGRLHFKKVISNSAESKHTTLHGKDLETILTTSTKQYISGYTVIDDLIADEVNVNNTFSSNLIFNTNIEQLYAHIKTSLDINEIFDGNNKFPGKLYVRYLNVDKMINNQPIEKIEKVLAQLDGNIKLIGSINFKYDTKISNLFFNGNFNDIPSNEFGRSWLLKETDQEFIATQTFDSISLPNGMHLDGTLNNIQFGDFISKTYWLNRNEHFNEDVSFKQNVALDGGLRTEGIINKVNFKNHMLLRNSDKVQKLHKTLECAGQIKIEGEIENVEKINNFKIKTLKDYLRSRPKKIILNDVVFERPPKFQKINSVELNELAKHIWFKHKDVYLDHHIEIKNGEFLGPVQILGPINGMNLDYLTNNYFSLSKAQEINIEMKFGGKVKFEDDLVGDNLHVYGPIQDLVSNKSINLKEFISNSFMKDKDQFIEAQWTIPNVFVKGNLSHVLINKLNFNDDVVRFDVEINNVTGSKYVTAATIRSLHTSSGCQINNFDFSDIIRKTVFVHDNYTIQGTTKMDTTVLYNDAIVLGTVNNIKFNESTLLLRDRDQTIHGNLRLVTKFPEKQQILPCTFKNINTKYVNQIMVNEFFKSVTEARKDIYVHGELVFKNLLAVQNFNGNGYLYNYNTNQELDESRNNSKDHTVEVFMQNLNSFTTQFTKLFNDTIHYYLSHFEHRQTIKENAKKIVSLSLQIGKQYEDVIAVLRDNNQLGFYRWNEETDDFVLCEDLSWSQKNEILLDISVLSFGKIEFLFIESIKNNLYQQNVILGKINIMTKFVELESNMSQKIEGVQINGRNCFLLYSYVANAKTPVYCILSSKVGQEHIVKLIWQFNLHLKYPIQITNVYNSLVAILYKEFVEIRNLYKLHEMIQTIPVVNPSQIVSARYGEHTFLAVSSRLLSKSFHFGSVEIYASSNGSSFDRIQTIEVSAPLQIEFSFLERSNDLLLYILSYNVEQPLFVYRYKGIAGFESIIKTTTLIGGNNFSVINLNSNKRNFVSIASPHGEISLVESVLKF